MNKLNRIQTGGFPLSAERLQEAEDAYNVFNALGEIAGNKAIIKGCQVFGSNTANGFVYIDGELFEFRGGLTQANVKILEEALVREFQNGESREIYYTRYVTFASGSGSIPWADFVRPFSLLSITSRITELEKQNAVFQANGAMVFWNKPAVDIPTGWQEVINWRGRVPVGFDSTQTEFNLMGKQDGSKTRNVTATLSNPINGFGVGGSAGAGDGGKVLVGSGNNEGSEYLESIRIASSAPTTSLNTTINIMNPYRVVMFIEYIG